jgi:prepilin-type N-terminal cleavage/methylation domain-containing protein
MVTRRGRARGMTLIEVMVALLVTTVALLGALATVGITVRGASFSRSATEASALAQSKLEEMVSLPAANVTLTVPTNGTTITDSCLDGNGVAPTTCSAAYPYTRTAVWGTTTVPDALRRTITVTVTWTDGLGKSHSVVATRQKDPQ